MKEKNNNNSFIGESKRESYKDFDNLFQGVESFMGYLPNAHLAMAERPELLIAFSGLASTVFQAEGIDIQTKQLIALASSLSSGCKYCQAHTSHGAERAGMKEEKIAEEKEKKEKGIKTVRCSGIRSNGERCGNTTETADKTYLCYHHAEFTDGMDRDNDGIKEYRCTATKKDGNRCKNKTENKNKKCYAHQ